MIFRTHSASQARRSSDVGMMLALALGAVFGPVIAVDLVALLAGWAGQ